MFFFMSVLRFARVMALQLRLVRACNKAIRAVIRVVSWIPVLFVSAVLVWGYYVYVFVMNFSGTFPKGPQAGTSIVISVIFVVCAHMILGLLLVSYIRTIFTKHKPVPGEFHLTEDLLDRLDEVDDDQLVLGELASGLPVNQRSRSGGIRYCDTCNVIKPDRCHHCSLCDKCVLKMDHHCPWVNNCVGWTNYKFFFLFLFYTVLLCVWVALTGAYDFVRAWSGTLKDHQSDKFQVIFCFIVCTLFGLSTSCLLFFHTYLCFFNKTTLENMQPPCGTQGADRRMFSLGLKENLCEVFGTNLCSAFLPINTSRGDGVSYHLRSRGHVELGVVTAEGQSSHCEESDEEFFNPETLPLTRTDQL